MNSIQIRTEALRLALAIKPGEYSIGGDRYAAMHGAYAPEKRVGGWTPEQFIEAATKIETWITASVAKKPAAKPSHKR